MSSSLHISIRINTICNILVIVLGVVLLNIANLYLLFDLYDCANIFIRVSIRKYGCISVGTNLCINALVLIRILVFI